MEKIITETGEVYEYDPEKRQVFKGKELLPESLVEPVFSGEYPTFSGIYFKDTGRLLGKSGKLNITTSIESI